MWQQLQYIQSVKTSIFLTPDALYDQFTVACHSMPHYFYLLSAKQMEEIHLLNAIRDIYIALRKPEQAVLDPDLSMIYVVRTAFVTETIYVSRFKTLRTLCQRHEELTLLIAILLTLKISFLLTTLYGHEPNSRLKESKRFLDAYNTTDILFIYDQAYLKRHGYPKELAKSQAVVAQSVRNALFSQQDTIQSIMQNITSLAQNHITLAK